VFFWREIPMFGELLAKVATVPAMTWFTLRVVAPLDLALLRATNGRRSLTGPQALILVTKGARSGQIRETSLPGLHFEGEIILVASKGGNAKHPGWYHNLVANPNVEIVHRGSKRAYRARVVEANERERFWQWLLTQWDGFATYAERAAPREIPIVALEPIVQDSHS
jgi:deazaflavin-dependent oxidoreductase (nitroreductase family)